MPSALKKTAAVSAALNALINSPRHLNPALVMHDRILTLEARGELSYEAQIAMWAQIELAIKDGEAERDEVRRALRALADASPVPARRVPTGF